MNEYKCLALYVDLTNRKYETRELPDDMIHDFLGGYGLNARLGYELIKPQTHSLSENNPIVIGTGPLTGTAIPGCTKTSMLSKFPLTGTISNAICGCRFGMLLRQAGYGNLIITGKADSPIYIKILDDKVEFHDATPLLGKDIFETTDDLWRHHGSHYSVIAIGEAGENQVPISLAFVDKLNTWGKGGLGAVIGSKNLKAIMVNGNKGINVYDPKGFLKIIRGLFNDIVMNPDHSKQIYWGKMGFFTSRAHELGWGYQNYTKNCPGEIVDLYDPKYYETKFKKYRGACPSCPAGCKDILELKDDPALPGREIFVSSLSGRLNNWGSRCNVGSYENLLKCHDLANRGGICVQTFTGLFDLSAALYEKGIIPKSDTGGLEIKRDFATVMTVLKQAIKKEGFGSIMSEGYLSLIKRYGKPCESITIHAKGMDVQADPRYNKLNSHEFYIATNPRGSSPLKGVTESYLIKELPISVFKKWAERTGITRADIERIFYSPDRYHISRLAKHAEDWTVLCDSLGAPCWERRINNVYNLNKLQEVLFCATGIDMQPEYLKAVGERGVNMEKILNVSEGFSRKNDRFPERWFEPILFNGKEKYATTYFGEPFTKKVANQLLDDYYDEKGWDKSLGIPTVRTLKKLNLSDVVEDFKKNRLWALPS